ncbi:hypothetical protein AMJ52_03310 [candidate division TA06 bacterium DG_78]|uniref:Secretion system C-terminal sorting domain-containing protein n=1 Tax=candidate division TA06 bacterium DG_78 TaxID=1703772 RepID=A0A0S7YG13_UNCT6|nr:MAG: hypothetical protein AMJ52_03310 [candidate division TA06 bacterium DG_78]
MNRLMMFIVLALIVPVVLFAQINWSEHTISDSFDFANTIYAIDLDDDGDIDVLGGGIIGLTWWENDGNEKFTEHTIDADFETYSLYAIDIDNDDDVDILGAGLGYLVGYGNIGIAWWENDGNKNFVMHPIWGWVQIFIFNCHAYPIDLDGDNDVDVLGVGWWGYKEGNPETYWWENDGGNPPIFYEHEHELWDYPATFICGIDLDSDGDIDVLEADDWLDTPGWDIFWRKNNGSEIFSSWYGIDSTFVGATSVYAIDIDNDSDVDVLGSGWGSDDTNIAWYENDGNMDFCKHPLADDFNRGNSIYAIDVDDDGDVDILAAGEGDVNIAWWENNGGSPPSFTEHTISDDSGSALSVSSVYAIDLDDDGDTDVLGAGWDNFTWWESDLATVDVSPISIDIPSTLPEDTTLNPQATVTNFGSDSSIFDVTCEIDPGAYTSTENVTNLAPNDSIQVTFPDGFAFVSGFYTVTVYTQLVGDDHPGNDTLERVIEATGIAEGGILTPVIFAFSAPTISNGTTEIEFILPEATKVDLVVYDALGRLSKTVVSKCFSAGNYTMSLQFDLPTGIYFYRLKTASGEEVTKKFLLIE